MRFAAIVVAAACVVSTSLLAYTLPLLDPWETHYLHVTRVSLRDGDTVSLPSPGDAPPFLSSKPPLFFWAQEASVAVARATNVSPTTSVVRFAARIPSLLFGILAAIGSAALAHLVSTHGRASWRSVLVAATCPFMLLLSAQGLPDIGFICFITWTHVCIAGIVLGKEPLKARPRMAKVAITGMAVAIPVALAIVVGLSPSVPLLLPISYSVVALCGATVALREPHSGEMLLALGASASLALATLTKGPLALGLVGLSVAVNCALGRRRPRPRWRVVLAGALLYVTIVLPWHHALIVTGHEDSLWRYLVDNHLRRAALPHHQVGEDLVYYVAQLVIGLGPWAGLAMVELVAARDQRRMLLVVPVVVHYLVFATISTKYNHYISTAVPLLCALVASARGEVRETGARDVVGVMAMLLWMTFLIRDDAAKNYLYLVNYSYVLEAGAFAVPAGYSIPWPLVLICVSLGALPIVLRLRSSVRFNLTALAAAIFSGVLVAAVFPSTAKLVSQGDAWSAYLVDRRASDCVGVWESKMRGEDLFADRFDVRKFTGGQASLLTIWAGGCLGDVVLATTRQSIERVRYLVRPRSLLAIYADSQNSVSVILKFR